MQSLTLVLKISGLLLVTPHTQNGSGPTQILMPEPHNVGTHVAKIGYRRRNGTTLAHCDSSSGDICWVRMQGWSMDLGSDAGTSTIASTLPHGAGNLTRRLGGQLPSDHAGPKPKGLDSRLTLHAGGMTSSCGLAEWRMKKIDHPNEEERVRLINLMTWEMQYQSTNIIILKRKQINALGTVTEEVVDTLRPDGTSRTIELHVRHDPVQESEVQCPGGEAVHFAALYHYLGIQNRRLPRCVRVNSDCSPRDKRLLRDAPGTLSCMIASGGE